MKVKSLSRARLLATPWTAAYQAPLPMDFPGKSTGVGAIAFPAIPPNRLQFFEAVILANKVYL